MTTDEIRHLFAYTEWANGLVLDAADKLPSEQLLQDTKVSHGSILGTLAHMAGAEWIWLERWLGNTVTGPNAWEQWTVKYCDSMPTLRSRWQPLIEKRHAYLERLTDAELPRDLTFTRLTGETYALPLVQQLQHVVNHATLHRGQVVSMIRQLGITPPATDLLFYLFERR